MNPIPEKTIYPRPKRGAKITRRFELFPGGREKGYHYCVTIQSLFYLRAHLPLFHKLNSPKGRIIPQTTLITLK